MTLNGWNDQWVTVGDHFGRACTMASCHGCMHCRPPAYLSLPPLKSSQPWWWWWCGGVCVGSCVPTLSSNLHLYVCMYLFFSHTLSLLLLTSSQLLLITEKEKSRIQKRERIHSSISSLPLPFFSPSPHLLSPPLPSTSLPCARGVRARAFSWRARWRKRRGGAAFANNSRVRYGARGDARGGMRRFFSGI